MRRASAVLLLWAACAREEPPPVPEAEPLEAGVPEVFAGPEGWPPDHGADRYEVRREAMVREQIWGRGVRDRTVIASMQTVPRHRFVPDSLRNRAYGDHPLPIGYDQTISQPYIVASMTEELQLAPGGRVLEIGTGSGYQAAVLARITPFVFTIEIKAPLHERSSAVLRDLGYTTVRTRLGDGYYGWPEEAPFDAILVTAAAPHVPPPLVRQLKAGGRMVLPVGPVFGRQDLLLVAKDADGTVRTKSLYAVRFVPLTGALGSD